MTSALFSLAENALQTPFSEGETPLPSGVIAQKEYHWSIYVLAGGALTAAIVLVAGAILQSLFIAGFGGFFLTSYAIGIYYNHQFSIFKNLEGYIRALAGRIQDFAEQNKILSREANNVKSLVEDLKKLKTEKEKMEKEFTLKFQQKNLELEEINGKFTDVTKNLKKILETREKELLSLNGKLENEIAEMKKENETFSAEVKKAQDVSQKLTEENSNLKEEVEKLSRQNKEYDSSNKKLEETLKKFELSGEKSSFDIANLESNTEKLKKISESLVESEHKVDIQIQNLEEIEIKIAKNLEKLKKKDALQEALDVLRKLKKERQNNAA